MTVGEDDLCARCGHDRVDHDPIVKDDEVVDGPCRDGWETVSTWELEHDEEARRYIGQARTEADLAERLAALAAERERHLVRMTQAPLPGSCHCQVFMEGRTS